MNTTPATTDLDRRAVRARLARVPIPAVEAMAIEDTVIAIESLKRDRGAIVLAHNYMTPDIYHTVADFTGDSLALAQLAATTDADVIVMATHGKSHTDAFWSGSVSPRVSNKSKRPLLLVPVAEGNE